ncbi:hypothetical protein WJ972_13195 [Achromobacter insuavis]
MLSNQPARLRLTAAVLLIAVLAGAVALMRGNPAQSSESTPARAAAAPAPAKWRPGRASRAGSAARGQGSRRGHPGRGAGGP